MSLLFKEIFKTAKLVLNPQKLLVSQKFNIFIPSSQLSLCSAVAICSKIPNFQLTSVRCASKKDKEKPKIIKDSRVFKRIRGGGRPLPEGVIPPQPRIYGWRPILPEDGKYTTMPLPIVKLGGRDPKTGRVVVKTIGGGHKKKFRWVDSKREAPSDGSALEEKVFQVRYDPCRTARIALVASGDHKRWILASENMKVGDIIKTSGEIPRVPVVPQEGNAHPLGALPQGTLIHNVEAEPGRGGLFCRAAGSAAQLIRKMDDKCLVQLPSKQQILVDEKCMAVVGRVSNIAHGSIPIGSPNRMRWLGKRPRSGLWHRKDGYCGRKIHPPKSIKDLLQPRIEKPEIYELTWRN